MPRKRLTRQQIKEGLEQVPVEQVLLGHSRAHGVALTPKQLKFAEELARGESKAGAYRKAYNTKSNHKVQSVEGQKLAKHPAVSMQVEAIKLALEAEKYATPLHLRALVIQRLTEKALDPDVNHAQQLRALELLGKVTEIAAFTERRETVHVHDAQAIREKLLNSLRAVAQADAVDVEATDADDLLAELAPTRSQIPASDDPPPPDPQDPERAGGNTTHSNPHPRSSDCNNVTLNEATVTHVTLDRNKVTLEEPTVTHVTVDRNNITGGGGVELLEAKDR